jgi:hypothetical protein
MLAILKGGNLMTQAMNEAAVDLDQALQAAVEGEIRECLRAGVAGTPQGLRSGASDYGSPRAVPPRRSL